MAQAKVTNYFSTRKRNADFQPSKRRKIIREQDTTVTNVPVIVGKKSKVRTTENESKSTVAPVAENLNVQTKESRSSKSKASTRSRNPKCSRKTSRAKTQNKDIRDVFKKLDSDDNEKAVPETEAAPEALSTAACDDHQASPPSTPSKRASKTSDGEKISQKRSRVGKVVRKDLLQDIESEKGYDFSQHVSNPKPKTDQTQRTVLRRKSKEAPSPEKPLFTPDNVIKLCYFQN